MRGARLEHPAVVRLCHWLAALAVTMLIASGLLRRYFLFGAKPPETGTYNPLQKLAIEGPTITPHDKSIGARASWKSIDAARP